MNYLNLNSKNNYELTHYHKSNNVKLKSDLFKISDNTSYMDFYGKKMKYAKYKE